ncbi:MAG: VC_2705 family sodium/solute symporter, partial [Desulfonatronovibrio sp.]
VAQYCVLIVAFIICATAISMKVTGTPIPQLGFGSTIIEGDSAGKYILEALNGIHRDLGFSEYTSAFGPDDIGMLSVICITLALMVGTAGLPHVIIRFYTVPSVKAARLSAGYALFFIALLYTTAPTVAAFARYNMIDTVNDVQYSQAPSWFKNWEQTGLVAWIDKDGDGIIRYRSGSPFQGTPQFSEGVGQYGQRLVTNKPTDNDNELYVDRDIIVLASPEMANLSPWIIGLMAAGGLAAALSTASGLLIVISSSVSHDLYYRIINRQATEKQRMLVGRIMVGVGVLCAGYLGINPPGFVAQVVAFAFGLAASSFFPVIILGIFTKWVNREGAIAGMISGIGFTMFYILQTRFFGADPWFFGITAEGIGTIGMLINFAVTMSVSKFTKAPPAEIQELVENVRSPRGAGAAIEH